MANGPVYLSTLKIPRTMELSGTNGPPIATYGIANLTLKLGLKRDFPRRLIMADVSKLLLGVDFLAH